MNEPPPRRTQADRRAKSREAILTAAARGLSTYGYTNLGLEQVTREAGYTRGALYHLFANKEQLALAVVEWVAETWDADVLRPAMEETDPLTSLLTMARRHALFCRRDVARAMLTLRVEFAGQDHPVGHAVGATIDELESRCAALITEGRRNGSIPPGPPARLVASAFTAVMEAVGIEVAGKAPHDVRLMDQTARGVLGLDARDPMPDA